MKTFPGFLQIKKNLDIGAFVTNKDAVLTLPNMCPGYYYCFVKKTAATGKIKEIELKHESYLAINCNEDISGNYITGNNMFVMFARKEEQLNDPASLMQIKRNLRQSIERWGLKKGQVKTFHNQYLVAFGKECNSAFRCFCFRNTDDEISGVKIVIEQIKGE